MKISWFHIKNIKGIKDLELLFKKDNEILDVIVLAGVNGSGKTTILESIKDFFNNKNINYKEPKKSNVDLDIFFEDFEKNNIEEMVNGLDLLMNNSELYQQMSEKSRVMSEDYGIEKIIEEWKAIL